MFDIHERMVHTKQMRIKHWRRILSGSFDADYAGSVSRIGRTHYRLGLRPRWYVGGYALLVAGFVTAVEAEIPARRFGRDDTGLKRGRMIAVLTTAALLDMDLAISVYLEEGERAKAETVDWLEKSFSEILDIVAGAAAELESTAAALTQAAETTQQRTTEVANSSDAASTSVQSVAPAMSSS